VRPTLEARGLKASLLQYLSTTYALTDEGVRLALEEFLGNETSGMFRGPFLRIRTPFRPAAGGWSEYLDWVPDGFEPYVHQAQAFERLSSKHHSPRPTLITTGTGSGKTESFLIPILDHCRRVRATTPAAANGVKAILLYPMNALATDQAMRLNEYLGQDALKGVTAGLYIGERASTTYGRVLTSRQDIRRTPPDLLITNYKMLDLLLQRGDDAPLWQDSVIQYVVVDEFHTYDGAQGTDVAMLLRRLASRVGASSVGSPLGSICPVATSATLATQTGVGLGASRDLLRVAEQVFGTEFTPDSVIGEQRATVAEFVDPDFTQDPPTPEQIVALPDPALGPEALAALAQLVAGEGCVSADGGVDRFALGALLKRRMLTYAVMMALGGEVKSYDVILAEAWRHSAQSWSRAVAQDPELAAEALARFVALLSEARDPASDPLRPRPLVHVEVHQWARSVTRLLRGVLPWPHAEFRWDALDAADAHAVDQDRTAPSTTVGRGVRANLFLPAVYCRDCGRSGWAVYTPESDDLALDVNPIKIRRASAGRDKIRVRNLIAATVQETKAGREAPGGSRSRDTGTGVLMVLDGLNQRLRSVDELNDFDAATGEPALRARDSAFVLVQLGPTANTAGDEDWCPACGTHRAIRYLGTGLAALAAASLTQLFTGPELRGPMLDPTLSSPGDPGERKTLMFCDSVQDAAHRAGFVASRSYTFSLRALLASKLTTQAPVLLNDLIADVIESTDAGTAEGRRTLAAVVPPDLHDDAGVARLLSGRGRGGDLKTWRLIGERLTFAAVLEFGLRARQGRTLELTRTAAAFVQIPDPASAIAVVRSALSGLPSTVSDDSVVRSDARVLAFLRVFLERLRMRGAIKHRWLEVFIAEAGVRRRPIWAKRPQGMPAFPNGISAPSFLLDREKSRSEFDRATGRLSWYERWAQHCFELPRDQIPALWAALLPALVDAGLLSVRTAEDGATRIYGLKPGAVNVRLLHDDEVNIAYVRCNTCFWEQTVHPSLLTQWDGQPCPGYRCKSGRLIAGTSAERDPHIRHRDFRGDYYRQLYMNAGTYQIITAEHTGMLTRPQREQVEAAFRTGANFNDPNVLACTPTLELGIDIGDLSAVVLASLPRTPANYAQRVGRAGRRTGNAYLLTIPDRSRRDLYFLEQPHEMIAGQIIPPGCHLSAVEILRRQFFAYLLDLAVDGRVALDDGALRALPRKAQLLFEPDGYLAGLLEAVAADPTGYADRFLELFPTGVSDQAREALRDFATGGLHEAIAQAKEQWRGRLALLHARLGEIDEAREALNVSDPDDEKQEAELDAERRAVGGRLRDIGQASAHETLVELGLLPNYALIDTTTRLEATLYWESGIEEKSGRSTYKAELREYERARRLAIRDLAPGNEFYVNGYKHAITGVEIGNLARPGWQVWRVCPGCGYVRTENATDDRSPCPRCHTTRIFDDGSCVFNVVEPTLVTSRDKREDARISDDADDRTPRFYETVTTVDMAAGDLVPGTSWRHATQVFGIDFSRRARVRRLNLGPARFDAPPRDEFAGFTVRLNPFSVCTGCGAASADGRPVIDQHIDALSSSAARDPLLKHHRPWCPRRRGKDDGTKDLPVLLAHQLETEAVRVLLPAATVLVEERVYSVRAALRLGVDRAFGGDPVHIESTVAFMADQATGEQRCFLVLYDALPGGTGYLQQLTDPDGFRAVLTEARTALTQCPCAGEGRRACHRCLHRYTPESKQDIVDRREALDVIEQLLESWQIQYIADTHAIGLDAQVESDLEARFLAALRAWAVRTEGAVLDEEARRSAQLRIAPPGRTSTTWHVSAQYNAGKTRPDFTFQRLDGPAQTVHVYLDGLRWHASPESNRLAHDASTRTRLRAEGHLVFQLTWDDLDLFEGRDRAEPVWPPYPGGAQDAARAVHQRTGGEPASLAEQIWTNPLSTLLAFLSEPDTDQWARRAGSAAAGLLRMPGAHGGSFPANAVPDTIHQALLGHPPAPGGAHPVTIATSTDAHGLPLVLAVDNSDQNNPHWTALAILDDSPTALGAGEHKMRWRAWLYWSNLIQFLALRGGDGVQLTTSQAPAYPVQTLAVCGGIGELSSLSGPAPANEVSTAEQHLSEATTGLSAVRDQAWDTEILPTLDQDEPGLASLARTLAERGIPAPEGGYELGFGGYLAEMAWHDYRLAIVLTPHGPADLEAAKRDAAYTDAGWTVYTAAEGHAHLQTLVTRLNPTPTDSEGAAR
jgi:replicative superfamily II helicase